VVPAVVVDMLRVQDPPMEIHILAHPEQHLLMDGVMLVDKHHLQAVHIMDLVAAVVPLNQVEMVIQSGVDMVVMVCKFLQPSETPILNQTPLLKVVV
tara:strand:+ start:226 stop:516 length:291 start_codon:yes stop_codon:yes gene_type:complete